MKEPSVFAAFMSIATPWKWPLGKQSTAKESQEMLDRYAVKDAMVIGHLQDFPHLFSLLEARRKHSMHGHQKTMKFL